MPHVIYPQPAEEMLMEFMIENCRINNHKLEFPDIMGTVSRKAYHPYAAGHLSAVQYAVKLVNNHAWPVRTPFDYSNEMQSDKNLYWLKDLHDKIMKPVARAQQTRPDLIDIPPYPLGDCGSYRLNPIELIDARSLIEGKPDLTKMIRKMPRAGAIKKLMHLWHKDLCEFHQSYTKKIDNPRLLKPEDIMILATKAHDFHLQLQCIKPFAKGNGRVARILENALRLRWGLAWKTIKAKERLNYVTEIINYEDSEKWMSHLLTHDAK